ncbi:GatB/YqeY domain-containing protein [Magnetospira sp. QH-2]|uniref:GatB/YqeY domain-containing protein n=1 Tax=Magnetospira sp. (strain QH-2) TaxID=1288970 RepID=UPI0003E80D5B|nr:GatB/YqeY domain-containing protein [Magnetospira sp. QH-2]CCQ72452.1 Aspartyl/glutamyl-tRNA(Asn/Gln) amidotransferase subunit B (Asp/Glu-ADT subunit B) [Magnetospira sp. QH-2]
MLRERLKEELNIAMKAKDSQKVATLRLILAALKDRDIAARGKGHDEAVKEDEILSMLQSMVKQRRESIAMYEKGGRLELARQEADEISVIETFLPQQLEGDELLAAVEKAVAAIGATSLKDMGKVMGVLKADYAGQMDFGKASAVVKAKFS